MKKIMKFTAALLAAVCIANLLCAGIYTLPAKYTVTGKATGEVWQKNSLVIMGLEGFAVNRTDAEGYNNPNGILEQEYAVALGSSHTQGFNVDQNENYCSLYNEYAKENGLSLLYNAGMDANNFADITKHFPTAVSQFADAEYFVIETPYFTFTEQALSDALDTVEYDESARNTGILSQFYGFIQSMPLARLAVKQLLETDTSEFENAFFQADAAALEVQETDYLQYSALLEECFAVLRQTTDKPIFLLYHRALTENGIDAEAIEGNALLPLVNALCEEYGITLITTDEAYLENYRENGTLPYGFYNTVYGEGHLNQTGHSIIANLLKEAVKEDIK